MCVLCEIMKVYQTYYRGITKKGTKMVEVSFTCCYRVTK